MQVFHCQTIKTIFLQENQMNNDKIELINQLDIDNVSDFKKLGKIMQDLSMVADADLQKASKALDNIEADASLPFEYENFEGIDIDTRFIDIPALKICLNTTVCKIKSILYTSVYYDMIKYNSDKDFINRYIFKYAILKNKLTKEIKNYYKSSIYYENIDEYITMVTDFILIWIKDHNQASAITYKYDMFIDETEYKFKNQELVILSKLSLPKIPEKIIDEEIMSDFKLHFDIDSLLEILLISIFGDRKRAYIWLQAPSNFGKSFLFQHIFYDKLEICLNTNEAEIKNAVKGNACGLTPASFINKWVLFIDEFNSNVKELKNITHELTFSPKYESKVQVQLYAKVCASAESVSSLSDGGYAETQYANRFLFWKETGGPLTDRVLFKQKPNTYANVLSRYSYEYLAEGIERYTQLGRDRAAEIANKKLDEIYKAKNQQTKPIEEMIEEYLIGFKQLVYDNVVSGNAYNNYYVENNYCFIHGEILYVSNKSKMADSFVNYAFGDSLKNKENKKSNDIKLGLNKVERQNFTINGKAVAGYPWYSPSQNRKILSLENSHIGFAKEEDLQDLFN